MQLFTDTNIFLYYLEGKIEEEAFSKLLELIKNKKISSIITSQIIDEYTRNFISTKNDKIKQIESSLNNITFKPIIYSSLKKFNTEAKKMLKTASKQIDSQKKNIIKEKKRFVNREKKIKDYFQASTLFKDDPEILKLAEYRFLKGNPPQKNKVKNNSYGDAINWELLLKYSDKKDDLVIVSFDSDYAERLFNKTKINSLLLMDWKKFSKKRIKLFSTIGEFINFYEGKEVINKNKIKIEKENIEDDEFKKRNEKLLLLKEYVREVISKLSSLEQKILEMRFGLIDGRPHTLEEVGYEFNITRENIRKIESKALERIQKYEAFNDFIK